MRKLIVGILLFPLWCFAGTVTVTGIGNDFEEAKYNGFRNAIETHLGTLVLSEREHHNYKTVKNELLVYSSGYIDRYDIVSQQVIRNKINLVMDVTVNSNKISNRIVGQFKDTNNIDGYRIKTQIDTYQSERLNADKVLKNVLEDYPHRAYNIEQLPYRVETDNNRNGMLVMPYKLSWNYNYISSLNDTLAAIQDAEVNIMESVSADTKNILVRLFPTQGPRNYTPNRPTSIVSISAKAPNDFVFGKLSKYGFNDTTHPENISAKFYNHEVRIMARILNRNNTTVWYICHHPLFLSGQSKSFYSIGDYQNISINGNAFEEGVVRLFISPGLYDVLRDSFKIQMQIVRAQSC